MKPLQLAVYLPLVCTSVGNAHGATANIPPCGIVLLNNSNFLVSSFSYLRYNDSQSILAAANWNASVTSVIAGCGGSLINGSFVTPNATKLKECEEYIALFGAHGVCWESRIYVDNPSQMCMAAENSTAMATAVASHAQALGLSGVSFDWERRGENKHSHKCYLNVTETLKRVLNPIGVRVTSFSNNFYHDIKSFKDLSWNNNKVLCGETYVGKTAKWHEQWHRLASSPASARLSPTLSSNTKHGSENCNARIIENRTRLIAQNFTELSIFSLNGKGLGHEKGPCFSHYVPYLKAFLNGTINQSIMHPSN